MEARAEEKNYIARRDDKYPCRPTRGSARTCWPKRPRLKTRFQEKETIDQVAGVMSAVRSYRAAFQSYVGPDEPAARQTSNG